MNVKKILSGALIGAFVFGVSASNIQPVSAASISDAKTTLDKYDKAKDKFDSAKDKYNGARDKFNRNNSDGNNPPVFNLSARRQSVTQKLRLTNTTRLKINSTAQRINTTVHGINLTEIILTAITRPSRPKMKTATLCLRPMKILTAKLPLTRQKINMTAQKINMTNSKTQKKLPTK